MTINDNSTKSINAAIIDLQNQIKQLQHKIDILSKNQLKEDYIELPDKVEYADEAGKAKEADHAKTADTAKYTSETENAIHAGYADIATKATQDASGNVITDTYATKTELTSGLSGKANTSHNHSAADITSGTLAVERGGTGQTTQADINKAIVGELPEGNSVVTDGTMFVSSYASDNGFADTNATNVPYKRKFSLVWEYIKGKISSVLGITNNKHIIKGETVDTNTYEDANPKLVFINSDGSQNASLTFTDYDTVQAPASVTLNGNQGGEYFIAPNIKATGKFYGSLDGTADNATKATQDASGNIITDTYATKTELSGKADKSHTHTKSQITDFPTSLPANGGTADIATKIVPNYIIKDFTTVSTETIKYIKIAQCSWYEKGTLQVYFVGNALEDTLIINFGGGNASTPGLCGHYTGHLNRVISVIAQKGSIWNGKYSIYVKISQITTCTVRVALLTGNCTIDISESTTAPTNISEWAVGYGFFGNITAPNITSLEQRVAALESKI